MKIYKLFLIISFSLISLSGCEKNEDGGENLPENPLTFDGVEVLRNVLPPGYYTVVRYTSENIAYTVNSYGKIFKTEDGGDSWTEQESGTELHLNDIFFFDDLHGYIVGFESWEGVILKTVDGGNTWISTEIQDSGLHNIHFINKETGFATGNKLFKTEDGGETWNEIDLGYITYGDINFYDERMGFMTVGGALLKTIDGGINWIQLENMSLNIGPINKIQILNGIAYFSSNSGKIFKTSDRGVTWETIHATGINSPYFINEMQAVGGGEEWTHPHSYFPTGFLSITNNGGRSWKKKYFLHYSLHRINDVDFVNDSTGLAVGDIEGYVVKINF